ncbi:MAG: GFA family protein, partial [Pseudomonadota bacterium]
AARQAQFAVTEGDPTTFLTRADSGNTITRWHCNACGSQLYSTTSADTFLMSIKAGSVTSVPHAAIRPVVQIFTSSKVAWADAPADLITYARGMRGEAPLAGGP